MEAAFKQANFEVGVISGIRTVTRHLTEHFPSCSAAGLNEFPDTPAPPKRNQASHVASSTLTA
jgi:hypothetical protein